MCRKFMLFVAVFVLLALADIAWAEVVTGERVWDDRTQICDLGGLEIQGPDGHAIFNARVDHDGCEVRITAGGRLTTNDTYKLPDNEGPSNVYVLDGTWNANNIESKGTSRAATIYVGATGVINIQIGYGGTAPYDNPADYDPLT